MENKFDQNLAKALGVKKITGLDKFSLFTGTVGLIGDTIGILAFAGGLIIPSQPKPVIPPEGGLLVTALLAFYFLTLLIWFLIRFERQKIEIRTQKEFDSSYRSFDMLCAEDDQWGVILVPLIGAFFAMSIEATKVMFFFSAFVAFLPTTLWIYVLSTNPWLALGTGILGGVFLAQYSTFFALILDKFFY